MTVTLYTNNDAPNKVTKQLTQLSTMEVVNKQEIDILNPVLYVNYTDIGIKANYMHIGQPFNRYYFIKNSVMTGGRLKITGAVDVLMSAGGALRQSGECVVERNEYQRNYYVNDKDITLSEKPSVAIKKWDYTFKDYSIFMLAAGGE